MQGKTNLFPKDVYCVFSVLKKTGHMSYVVACICPNQPLLWTMRSLLLKKNLHLPTIKIFGKTVRLPQMRSRRRWLGIGLVCGGVLGFLPIVGYWMLPLGLFILSYDSPRIRRMRRRMEVWLMRRTSLCQRFRKSTKLQKKNGKEVRLS